MAYTGDGRPGLTVSVGVVLGGISAMVMTGVWVLLNPISVFIFRAIRALIAVCTHKCRNFSRRLISALKLKVSATGLDLCAVL